MLKFLHRKYYPFEDYENNCKHKMSGQTSLSCRKRRDGTLIGSVNCRYYCKKNLGFGETKDGRQWIKCKYLKEAVSDN